MRRTTLLVLLSVAMILAGWAMPSLAQAPAAGVAKAPAQAASVKAPAAPSGATAPDGYALAFLLAPESACSAAVSPLPGPAIRCPNCPPGYVHCPPFCLCCRGNQ
jgi:hypothetical protein